MHWSKSRHVSYASCPRRFFYENIAAPMNPAIGALAKTNSPHLLRHTLVREIALSLVQTTHDIDQLSSIMQSAREILSRSLTDDVVVNAQISIIEHCIRSLIEHELTDLQNATQLHVSSGDPSEFSYDGISMMTLPELVLDRGGALEVISFKSGSSRFRDEDDFFLRAAGLTAWARSVMRWVDHPVRVTEIYLKEDCLRQERTLTDEEMRSFVIVARDMTAKYSRSAKVRDFPAKPEAGRCRFCAFRTICPEWEDFAEVDFSLEALKRGIRDSQRDSTPAAAVATRDLFLCHVDAEKESTIRPLVRALAASGISYWLDEAEILVGDSIIKKVNDGIRKSRFLLCFLSQSFVGRGWPEIEVSAVLNAELSKGGTRVLPVIVGDPQPILQEYPLLSAKRYLRWEDGVEAVVREVTKLLERPEES